MVWSDDKSQNPLGTKINCNHRIDWQLSQSKWYISPFSLFYYQKWWQHFLSCFLLLLPFSLAKDGGSNLLLIFNGPISTSIRSHKLDNSRRTLPVTFTTWKISIKKGQPSGKRGICRLPLQKSHSNILSLFMGMHCGSFFTTFVVFNQSS